MVDTQHFCLRWNNYQSSITSAFENLRDDEDFVDVTLACDGKSLKAHRVVLSACSPYFRELLKSTPCKHPVIVLQDVAWTDLHALVEFIYHGEVNVHQRSLSSFLKTAEVLRVSGLTQQHGDGRDQVQSMVRPHQQSTPIPNHHPNFTEKLEDALFTSPSSPPQGATVNQLLRRAAMQYRRERRILSDPENEHKRARGTDHLGLALHNNNNNNELNLSPHHMTHPPQPPPPQTQPADFSPSAMKNNALNLNLNAKDQCEGNGIGRDLGGDGSPACSPSPTSRCPDDSGGRLTGDIKNEPMELLCQGGGGGMDDVGSDDSNDIKHHNDNGLNNLPQVRENGAHSVGSNSTGGGGGGGENRGGGGGGDHDDHAGSAISPYLTPTESKLFATAAGTFNFSMAALAADPSALGGLNQSLQGNDLAGTSQGPSPKKVFTCQLCGKVLCSKASLKRHIADKHAERQEEYRCVICERVYCSRNSLMTHIYTYHKSRPGDIDIKCAASSTGWSDPHAAPNQRRHQRAPGMPVLPAHLQLLLLLEEALPGQARAV
ncbi:unnamed protein product [Callosobruchus maculatus]|uniref:Broad-complex n=1 Tax=Callosobruchus maculatus TaxID=64391 RepID=A0A653CWC7_CALMS|nr:unnamed protein product [Callosobruchus maculatus]